MKVLILKTTISPVKRRSPSILRKGTIVDVDEEAAKKLIDAEKATDDVPTESQTPDESWKPAALKKYAGEKKIDITACGNDKKKILEAILAAEAQTA